MIRSIMILLAAGLLALGCSQRSNEPSEAPAEEQPSAEDTTDGAAAEAPPTGDAAAAGDAGPSEEEVPVAEDFEEEAEGEISGENYRAELDRLAAEIEGDAEGAE